MNNHKLIISNLIAVLEEIDRIKSTGTEFTLKNDLNNLIEVADRNVNRAIYMIDHSEKDFHSEKDCK